MSWIAWRAFPAPKTWQSFYPLTVLIPFAGIGLTLALRYGARDSRGGHHASTITVRENPLQSTFSLMYWKMLSPEVFGGTSNIVFSRRTIRGFIGVTKGIFSRVIGSLVRPFGISMMTSQLK
jgi:hypothetical protein